MTFQDLLLSLTLDQAQRWADETDKWVYVDDYILAPNNFRANDKTVDAVEHRFHAVLSAEFDRLMIEHTGAPL